jgi:hypothetical protein
MITKLSWTRTSKDVWKSQTVAKRQYEIGRTKWPRLTGDAIHYYVACFARARSSGKWYVRFFHDLDPRNLKDAKAFAHEHATTDKMPVDPAVVAARDFAVEQWVREKRRESDPANATHLARADAIIAQSRSTVH